MKAYIPVPVDERLPADEWHPYNGDYDKRFYDIKLKDGTAVEYCWPNRGMFIPCKSDAIPIHGNRVSHLRFTIHKPFNRNK